MAYGAERMMLSVSDIVKMATAGVKVDLADLKDCVESDENLPSMTAVPADVFPRSLEDAFLDRWRRAHPRNINSYADPLVPYGIHAHEFAGIVYVMVCPWNQPPFLIEDSGVCYPSDALMAALALYESTQP
jgi:hypothetical protein